MRKLFLASLFGASVAIGTGCEALNKLMVPPAKTATTPTVTATPAVQTGFQAPTPAQLQQAAGFSANLQQAAGFGVVLNGPTSQLQQAAGLQQAAAGYRVQGLTINESNPTFKGQIGSGDLVASGSITGSNPQTVGDVKVFQTFTFDLMVATASKVPTLQGAKITGQLTATINSATRGLSGALTIASGSVTTPVDFTFSLLGSGKTKWVLTGPTMIGGVQHYSHLEVDSDKNGSGWIAKDKNGSTTQRVANCLSTNGKWSVSLIANSEATSSIDMPWSN